MAIVRWDPFGELMSMQRDMDRLFSRMGGGRSGNGEKVTWMPKVDVIQRGDDMVVKAELPGLKPEDVDISVTDNLLTIKGERKEEKEREDEGYLVRESSYGSFERSMMLPEGVSADDIKADYKDGILEVTVPKAAKEMQPKTTKVEIGSSATGAGGQGGKTS